MLEGPGQGTFIREIIIKYIYANLKKTPRLVTRVSFCGSMSNNVGDNLNQQNLLNYAAASIAN